MNEKVRSQKRSSAPPALWLGLGLGLLILVFYANSFSAGLVFDSDSIIRQDPRLHAVNRTNIEDILTRNYWWPSQESVVYRPLTTFSYLMNYAVLGNGENAGGYHAVNLLLHWTNAWLVLWIVRRLSGRLDIAALSASLFAVHPINTEAVTNIVGRADLLATLAVLFGGWCYLRAADADARRGRWLLAMGASTCLGVLAKENAVMIMAFVALYDYLWRWPEKLKQGLREWVPGYVALIPGLALFGLIRLWMTHSTPVPGALYTDNPLMGAAPFQRVMTAMGVIGRYVKLLVFPRTLSSDYSFNQIALYGTAHNSKLDALALVSLVAVIVLVVAALWFRRRPFVSWSVLFLFVMMLPTANLFISIGSIMAERFMYLPSIGFCALAAIAICGIGDYAASLVALNAQKTIICWVLPVMTVSVLGVRTYFRNADWQTELSVWKSNAAAVPGSYKAHMAYGDAIWMDAQEKGRPLEQAIDEVLEQDEIARSIVEPDPPIPMEFQTLWPYLDLGRYYRIKAGFLDGNGHHDEAMRLYARSLDSLVKAETLDRLTNEGLRKFKRTRGIPEDRIPDTGNAFVYQNLCLTYGKLEQWDKCEAAGGYIERIAPNQSMGYQLSGVAYINLHRYEIAAAHIIAEMLVDPGNSDWPASLRIAYSRLGVADSSLNTDSPVVRQHLNEAARLVVQRFEEAKQFERARELQTQFTRQYAIPPEVFSH